MIIAGMKVDWARRDVDEVALMYTSQNLCGVDITIKSYDDPTIDTLIKHSDEALEHIRRYESRDYSEV